MLDKYAARRRFKRTPEPPPEKPARRQGPLVFVVQKHAARRLHYDLRLEVDGALKSWAVPAGPSTDPADKRLAVMVEDHPLDYAAFEGTIPEGEYGAGQVIIWDAGDYTPETEGRPITDRAKAQRHMREDLEKCKISFILRGEKLKGSWTLVKMKGRGKDNWLLIKHQDDFAVSPSDILEKEASVATGLTLLDIKKGARPGGAAAPPKLDGLPGARRGSLPRTVLPMLASLAAAPFSNPDWLFEPKLDGYRTIAILDGGKARLLSRRGLDVTSKYPPIAGGLEGQPVKQAVLDGEVVGLDEHGKLCFQCLQGYLEATRQPRARGAEKAVIIYYVFDIIYLDGFDLGGVPLVQRKKVLQRVLRSGGAVRFLEDFSGDGKTIFKSAVKEGLEGVVAKKRDSVYLPGRRSSEWLKVKAVKTDDFIVGGYTAGAGARAGTFGALLLGYYDKRGKLIPAGSVGTGYDEATLGMLRKRLDTLKAPDPPFDTLPGANAPATWVRPETVVEVKFAEWTHDGRLRAPVYLRLRDDKPASEVRRAEDVAVAGVESTGAKDPPAAKDPPDGDGNISALVKALEQPADNLTVRADGEEISLTHLDKELWPGSGELPAATKRDLLIYLARVSPYLLPHLHDRPLTLSRYPDGINGEHFFQKHWKSPVPDYVAQVPIKEEDKTDDYLMCNNLPTLLWLGQVADIELHTWFSRITAGRDLPRRRGTDPTDYPDFIVFDVDPYVYSGEEAKGAEPELNRAGFRKTGEAAIWLKETLDGLGLASFLKTSGKTGLHIYVPIARRLDYEAVRAAAKTICEFVLEAHPNDLTTQWTVGKRAGKVFLDYKQNSRGKTLASLYSPRPAPGAPVSAPISFDELARVYPTDFTIHTMPGRLGKLGDLWAGVDEARSDLGKALKL